MAKSLLANPSWISCEILRLTVNLLEAGDYFHSAKPVTETVLLQHIVVPFPWASYKREAQSRGENWQLEEKLSKQYWLPSALAIIQKVKSTQGIGGRFNCVAAILQDHSELPGYAFSTVIHPANIHRMAEDFRKRWESSPEWRDSAGLVIVILATPDAVASHSALVQRQADSTTARWHAIIRANISD